MKILNVGHNYFVAGGSDRVLIETERMLKAKGHAVIPFCSKNDRNFESKYSDFFPSSVNTKSGFFNNPISFFYNVEAANKLSKLLILHDIDIAHLHIYYGKLTTSILSVLNKRKIPIVQTLHEYKLVCPVYTMERSGTVCNDCVSSSRLKCITNRCKDGSVIKSSAMALESYISRMLGDISKIDLFLSVSNFHRNMMIQGGVPSEKIEVLYNFIDVKSYTPNFDNEGYFLYFGRIERLKGIITLIESFSNLNKKLLIVGDGAFANELVEIIKDIPNIDYIGFKEGEELKSIISKSKCVLVPSEWYENCPMNVLEAKSLGKPVIGSNIGGIPELVRDGIDGYLFSPGNAEELKDAVKKVEKDLVSFGKNARLDVEQRFSESVYYKKLNRHYEKLRSNYKI